MKALYCCIVFFASITIGFSQPVAGDFRSFQTGNWNNVATWERFDGAVWVNPAPATPSSADGVITLFHTVTVPSSFSVTIDQVFVDIGGTLEISSGGTVTVANGTANDLEFFNDGLDYGFLNVSGILICNDLGSIVGTDQANANFLAGGIYRHLYVNTEGSIPVANWASTSRVEINGYTLSANLTATAGGKWGQQFGEFHFNSALNSPRVFDFAGLLTNITGEFRVISTGSGRIQLSTSQNPIITIGTDLLILGSSRLVFATTGTNTQVTIGRDFILNSTNTSGSQTNTTGTTTMNVTRDFSMNATGGQLILSSGAGAGNGTLNITGNFTLTAGTVTETSSGTGVGNVNFVGSGTHTFANSGTISNSVNFSVASLSTLDVGTSAITGGGSFTLNGTLRLGSTEAAGALQTGTTGGNLRVAGARTYASNSNIAYNGAAGQFIGNGFPSGGDVNLTINNINNVTLSDNLDIVALRTLTLTSGNIVIGAQTLTINGTVSGSGGMVGGASSNLVIGGTGNFGILTFSGTNQLNNFTLNRTSSGLVTLGGSLTILGTFTHTAGTLAIAGNTFTISGDYGPASPGELLVTASSTIVVDGPTAATLPSDFAFTGTDFGTLTLNRAGATLTTTSSITITNLNLTSGTFSNGTGITMATGGTITRSGGAMSAAPINTTNSYNVVYTSGTVTTGPELPTSTTALANLSKTGSGTLTLAVGADITVNGTLSLTSGSFNAGSNTIDLKGNFVSSAASTLTSSPVTFSGTTTLSGTSTPTFGDVSVASTLVVNMGSAGWRINGNLVNNGSLSVTSGNTTFGGTTLISGTQICSFRTVRIDGTLTAPAEMNVARSFIYVSGTFNANNGTINFTGTALSPSNLSNVVNVNFHNITIAGVLDSSPTLNLTGNFTNNGTFNRGTGTVVFKGTTIQSIQGSSVTDFNNISVTNSTGGPPEVQVQSNTNLRGTLTLVDNSAFDADGSGNTAVFTLMSTGDNPTADAGIATLPAGASVTGNVTVQRYMSIEGTGSRIYRYIASPVQTPAVSQIQAEIPVTGSFTGSSTCSGCTTNQSMFQYNESVITGDLNTGYVDFPDVANTETLASARGYAIYVRGNVDPVLSATTARWDVRAPINSGTVTFPATFTSSGTLANDGWNLVGNPYPATIDWDAASGWTRTGINNAIYMRDNGAGVVASYVGGVSANGGSRYIAIGQGFFVKSDGGPITFQATENVKAASQQTTFFREIPITDILRITLRQGTLRDESVIRFSDIATPEFDGALDGHKLKNEIFNLSSLTAGGLKLVVNALPKISCGTTVKLDISNAAQGAYQLDFSEFESFSNDVQISVYDAFTDTRFDARQISSYAFEVTADSSSFGSGRISVSFLYNKPAEALVDFPLEVCKGGEAFINIGNSETFVAYSVYRDGVAVTEAVYGNGGPLQIPLQGSLLVSGDNNFVLHYSPQSCQSMVSLKQIKIKSLDLPALTTTSGSSCGNGNVSLSASGGEEGKYRWYESETDNVSIAGASSGTYTTPLLNKSKTYYVSAINALGCEGARKPVEAVIHQYSEVIISVDPGQNKLTSSYETGNQWYFNGVMIPGATGKTVEANETGLYEVEVTIGNCTSRAGREMIILGLESDPGKGYGFFPNPVKDKLTIELNKTDVATQGMVYNTSGQPLGVIEFKSESRKLKGEYNFAEQAAGMYLIRILQGNKVINYKVIKK